MLKMKSAVIKNIILALVCFVIACVFWIGAMDLLLGFLGFHFGDVAGFMLVVIVNSLHYNLGYFHPDYISPNSEHNVFYGEYLYVKIISFLTIGTSIYVTRAKDAYFEEEA
jgi:hypothetical protein